MLRPHDNHQSSQLELQPGDDHRVVSYNPVTTTTVVSYDLVTTTRVISYDPVTTTRVVSYDLVTTLTDNSELLPCFFWWD